MSPRRVRGNVDFVPLAREGDVWFDHHGWSSGGRTGFGGWMRLLDCLVDESGDEPVITVRGEVDLSTADELHACLESAVGRGPNRVVLDLAELDYIDSAGLSVLVRMMRRLREVDSDLVLRSPTAGTFRLLEIAGLADRFSIER